MKQALLLLVLLFVAATAITSVSPGQEVRASYADVVENPLGEIILGDSYRQTTELTLRNSDFVVRTNQLELVWGTSRYALLASNRQGYWSVHEQAVTTGSFAHIEQPSRHGATTTTNYDLVIRTDELATCQWRFWTPNNAMSYQPIRESPSQTHTVEEFGKTYRFEANEEVPLEVRCENEQQNTTLRLPLIWTQQQPDIEFEFAAGAAINRQQPMLLEVTNPLLSSCELRRPFAPAIRSTATKNHVFRIDAVDRDWELRCTDVHDQALPEQEIKIPHSTEPPLNIQLRSERITNQQLHQLVLRTNQPATCRYNDERLGRFEGGLLHQQRVVLEERENDFNIRCETTTTEAELFTSVFLDRQEPELVLPSAILCGEDVILSVRAPGAQRLRVESDTGLAYMRTWPEDTDFIEEYHQPGMPGATQLTVTAYSQSGNTNTQTISNIPESDDPTCIYRPGQDINPGTPGNDTDPTQPPTTPPPTTPPGGPPPVTDDEFNITYQTEYPSICELKIPPQNPAVVVESHEYQQLNNRTYWHTFVDMQQYLEPGTTEYRVTCLDPAGQETDRDDNISWQAPPPEFTLTANPQTIDDPENPYSTLTINAQNPVKCKIDEGNYNQEYQTRHERQVTIPHATRTINVTCKNPHDDTLSQQITINENLPSNLEILLEQAPNITTQTNVDFEIRTTQRATCSVLIQSREENDTQLRSQTLTTNPTQNHQATLELSEATHNLTFICEEDHVFERIAEKTHTVTVDNTPPTLEITSSQMTCGLTEYAVTGRARDNHGVERIEITFAGNTYTTKALPYRLTGLSLNAEQTYEVRVTAYDKAGNPSDHFEDSVTAYRKRDGACDDVDPVGNYHANVVDEGVELTIFCEDDQACTRTFKFGSGALGGACELQNREFPDTDNVTFKRSEPILITETSRVCYEVSDAAGNTYSDTFELTVTGEAPDDTNSCDEQLMCSNNQQSEVCGQTDVDCGGFLCGNKCELGLQCNQNSDCASGVCSDEGLCQAPTCEDGVRNGEETGVDCGGPNCEACSQGGQCQEDSDCAGALVCSFGTCMEQRNDRDTNVPPDRQEPRTPVEEDSGMSWTGLILIILGLVSILGGGGYIYYEKEQEEAGGAAAASVGEAPDFSGSPTQQQSPTQAPNFADSALREEAREKRKQRRASSRDELLGEFEPEQPAKHEQPPRQEQPSQPREQTPSEPTRKETTSHQTEETSNEEKDDVFDELERIVNNK